MPSLTAACGLAKWAVMSDLNHLRRRLEATQGRTYWRTLNELVNTGELQALVEAEFPQFASVWDEAHSRRQFLKLMGASLAFAGLSGCTQAPREPIVAYVRQPEEVVPGRPLYYATAMPVSGYANGGLLVKSHLGRPIKVEGNPLHPGSPLPPGSPASAAFGPSDLFAQASVLTLYDPDRSQSIRHLGQISSWSEFIRVLRGRLAELGPGGDGLCILTETVTSPTLASQLETLQRRYPAARWYVHEPVSRANVLAGARHAFGRPLEPLPHFDRADVVLALDADFLNSGPAHLRYARDFMSRRRARLGEGQTMNRLYVVESMPSGTGARADHRLPLRPTQIDGFVRALADQFGIRVRPAETGHGVCFEWIEALARDLMQHRGRCLIVAGEDQPPFVHAAAHALNVSLGNVGRTINYHSSVEVQPPQDGALLPDLVRRLERDEVRILLILGGNPAYTAPGDVAFAEAVASAGVAAHLSLYDDETSELCHWHLPEAHYLESWGDVRSLDGTVSLIQPLIAPLYGGRTALEVVAALLGEGESNGNELLRRYWRNRGLAGQGGDGFEQAWRRALHDGFIAGTQSPPESVTLQPDWSQAPTAPAAGVDILFRPDPALHDGAFANNGWLQELPKPLSTITWDNAAYMSASTAVLLLLAPTEARADVANGQILEFTCEGRRVTAPVWVLPGHADSCITVHLGYGRTRAGRVGNGIGFSAYPLRTIAGPRPGSMLLRPLGARHQLATTQLHHLMENRDLVREGTVQTPPPMPDAAGAARQTLSLYPEYSYEGNKWGMAIDLTACTGCSACIVACQAENNIPVVGKDQVLRGREMHWLRVDSYYKGELADPRIVFQPVTCMHCENAPCEVVCPVMATVHSSDGLNDMIYNRCVGTRYCSNNCPYKVRRFNFLQYADFETPSLQLLRNPEVTVRSRGVMEKCTYCVQRIRAAQIEADREGDRRIADGEVQTACQAACPARAIVFGDLNDRDARGRAQSKVAQLQEDPLNYALLHDLNTRPRTTYLAALTNPNPAMPPQWRAT
jgi:MoCo/4Fe-4S cofactor protein with predicted Tat translocation signal